MEYKHTLINGPWRRVARATAAATLLATALLAAGCDDGDTADRSAAAGGDAAIRLTATVATPREAGGPTRAYADAYNSSLPSGEKVDVFIYDASNNDISTSQTGSSQTWVYETVGAADATSGRSMLTLYSPSTIPTFPSSSDYVSIFATFPHNAGVTPSTTSWTFSAATQQTTSAAIAGSDLLANEMTATSKQAASAVNLSMTHRMAKVLVTFTAADDLTAAQMPAAGSTLTVSNVKTQLTITPKTGTVSTTGSTTTVTALVGEPFFLPPQTISAGTQLLQFNLLAADGQSAGIQGVTVAPSTALVLSAGVYYLLNVTVGKVNVTITSTITPWNKETLSFDTYYL